MCSPSSRKKAKTQQRLEHEAESRSAPQPQPPPTTKPLVDEGQQQPAETIETGSPRAGKRAVPDVELTTEIGTI